ncbi:RNA polymerase sigma-70 factor (ECF subfamily) [Cupriavidus agavae]|uniref:RNA polymerase sigma-70 factor (ECF subfamily) n=1 Tax=Cupriavidus agavae TaxID=1001822 RepID=A0A4Q7RZ57_9BURK|nr:RNA polymerase sigma-70 factor (ECF subfamily) [Cupriavidus agavae]
MIPASEVGSCPAARAGADTLLDLFVENRRALVGAAARIVGSRDLAEDVVQDAFLRLRDLTDDGAIRCRLSYLYQVVRNLAIDTYRRQSLEQKWMTGEDEGVNAASPTTAPDLIMIGRQALCALALALAELPERTQQAFEMCRVQGMAQKDIASQLGVSPTLVNFMVRDASIHCRARLTRQQAI